MRKTLALTALAALTLATTAPALVAPAHAQTSLLVQSQPQSKSAEVWQKIKGEWNVAKGNVKEQWGKLTDDDLLKIEGRRDQLVGRIQARYGVPRPVAEKQVSEWEVRYGG